jgi:uncharacterized protein (DUF1697 family)
MNSGSPAVVALLRGVNVGGNKTFRPSVLAKELSKYDVVNIGAAGTFVIRKPAPEKKLRADLLGKLPFKAELMICSGRDLIRIAENDPFGDEPTRPDIVRFMSVLSKPSRSLPPLPIILPPEGEWLLRIIGFKGQFVFGAYRRHMKTIAYLGQIEKILGVPATTRNWNTVTAIVKALKG